MAKPLQVILQVREYQEIRKIARMRHMTGGAWVRQVLEMARRREPTGEVSKKLQVVRAAAGH